MRKASVVAVALGLFATLSTAPTAGADPRFHGRSAGGRFGGGHSVHSHGPSVHKHGASIHKHGFGHHRVPPRHFVTFGTVVASPVVVYSSPPVFYAPPPYYVPVYAPPAVYSPAAYSQPAPSPPPPRVVQYSTGRYELRGDGIGTPYTWVWIPNPPPPPAAPPTAPPAGAPMSGGDAPPARRTQVYRWVDEQGVVHWTDRLEVVPRRHREEAKPLGSS